MKRERYKQSVSVFMFILDNNDNILLLERTNTGFMDGFYSVPAGALEANETALQAVMREAKEEVGITVKKQNIKLVHVMHTKTEGNEWMGLYFATNTWSGSPSIQEKEKHGDITWVKLSQLPKNTIPYVSQAIGMFKKSILYSEYGWN